MRFEVLDAGRASNPNATVQNRLTAIEAEGGTIVSATPVGLTAKVAIAWREPVSADGSAPTIRAALTALASTLRPNARPSEGDHDDMESAFSNGVDVANWEAADAIDAIARAIPDHVR